MIEGASVHESDWPYERAPLAERCGDGWARHRRPRSSPTGAWSSPPLGHAGGQGSSAYSQRPLWAPSRVPEVNTREVPKWMEADDIAAVVDRLRRGGGLGRGGRLRRRRGQRRPAQPGAPVPLGPHQPPRRRVGRRPPPLRPRGAGCRPRRARRRPVVGLRLSCDELAPWAGITPGLAPAIAAELAERRRLPRGRPRLDLLGREDPARLPRAARVQRRAVPRRAARPFPTPGRRRPAGLGRRRRPGRVGARRRRRATASR